MYGSANRQTMKPGGKYGDENYQILPKYLLETG